MKKLMLVIIAALAIGQAATTDIRGGMYYPLGTNTWDTLIAGDSAKTNYLYLRQSYLEGYLFVYYKVIAGGVSDAIKFRLLYEYGTDSLNLCRVTVDSLVAVDTVWRDMSATYFKPAPIARFIFDAFGAAGDTLKYYFDADFMPTPVVR